LPRVRATTDHGNQSSLDSDIVLEAGEGNSATGHVMLDLGAGTGTITFSGGTGKLAGFEAQAAVSADAEGLWHWVLAFAAILDGWSLRTTAGAWAGARGQLTWRRLLQETKAPELIVVFLKDLGAIIGVCIAAVGLVLASVTADGLWDALASIAIGILVMAIGLVVNRETQSLLVGEAAIVAAIRDAIAGTAGIGGVRALRTIHIGPDDLIVAAGVWVDAGQSAIAISRSIHEAERRVRAVSPFRTVVTVEPRVRDPDPGAPGQHRA
jgi:hypothetical protein